jgi:hypothetical protein
VRVKNNILLIQGFVFDPASPEGRNDFFAKLNATTGDGEMQDARGKSVLSYVIQGDSRFGFTRQYEGETEEALLSFYPNQEGLYYGTCVTDEKRVEARCVVNRVPESFLTP